MPQPKHCRRPGHLEFVERSKFVAAVQDRFTISRHTPKDDSAGPVRVRRCRRSASSCERAREPAFRQRDGQRARRSGLPCLARFKEPHLVRHARTGFGTWHAYG